MKYFLSFNMQSLQKPQNVMEIWPKTVLFRKIAQIFSLEKTCYLENRVVREPCKRRTACIIFLSECPVLGLLCKILLIKSGAEKHLFGWSGGLLSYNMFYLILYPFHGKIDNRIAILLRNAGQSFPKGERSKG